MIRGLLKIAVWIPILAAQTIPLTASESGLTILDAWIAEAPPPVQVNAGYLIINNNSDSDRILESVTSPAFGRVEMHRTLISDDGTSSMQQQNRITIGAGRRIEFRPGGYHLMLFDRREAVRTGMRYQLTLHFADGASLATSADVRRIDNHHEHH